VVRPRAARCIPQFLLLAVMPVFLLSTGLRTNEGVGGLAVVRRGGAPPGSPRCRLELAGVHREKAAGPAGPGRGCGDRPARLQTKVLIMIIFVNVLLDKGIITGRNLRPRAATGNGPRARRTPTAPNARPRLAQLERV